MQWISQQSQRLETGMPVAADDHMVVDGNSQGFGGLYHLARHLDIGPAGGGIAAGMVVNQNDRRGAELQRALDDLARINRRVSMVPVDCSSSATKTFFRSRKRTRNSSFIARAMAAAQ